MDKRFDRWTKRQILFGNPPIELFQEEIMKLSANDLLKLRLKLESQKRNIEMIEKVYLYMGATINAAIFMILLFFARDIFISKNITDYLGLLAYLLIGYVIFMMIILSIIQVSKNIIYNKLFLVKGVKSTIKRQ